jgi:U3 small nucleolar RNA-associated protein 11
MGTFKNAHRKRKYRERVQPAARAKLGFLEKHTDYVKRAKDHHKKRDQLRVLQTRAAQRNPDEFYFGMIKSRMINGKHLKDSTDRDKKLPTAEALALLKTQDLAYIATQRTRNAKQLQKLEEQLIETTRQSDRGTNITNRHIYFASDEEAAEVLIQELHKTGSPEDHKMAVCAPSEDDDLLAELEETRATDMIERELGVRRERVQMLSRLESKLRLDRHLLGKGRREKIGTDPFGFPIYKWAPERKK